MAKTEVYSWRLERELKSSLERAAWERDASVAALLESIVSEWLERQAMAGDDEEVQRRLHRAARESFGELVGGDPDLATEARERLRRKLTGAA